MRILPRLNYANVVSTVCLFVVLGGTSYAAVTVSSANVKNNSLTSQDIKDHSLLAKDFKAGQLPAGPKGPAGPAGPAGAAGPQGPAGADGQSQQPQPPAAAPTVARVKVDGLDAFDSQSFGFGGTLTGSGSGSGGGAGKTVLTDVEVSKRRDASSDELLALLNTGKHVKKVEIDVLPADGSAGAHYLLEDVTVRSLKVDGGRELLTFGYFRLTQTVS